MTRRRPEPRVEITRKRGNKTTVEAAPVPQDAAREVGEHPATVSYSAAMTRPLGAYESVKVSVHLSLPCDPTRIDEAFVEAREWVDERLHDVLEDLFDGEE